MNSMLLVLGGLYNEHTRIDGRDFIFNSIIIHSKFSLFKYFKSSHSLYLSELCIAIATPPPYFPFLL